MVRKCAKSRLLCVTLWNAICQIKYVGSTTVFLLKQLVLAASSCPGKVEQGLDLSKGGSVQTAVEVFFFFFVRSSQDTQLQGGCGENGI